MSSAHRGAQGRWPVRATARAKRACDECEAPKTPAGPCEQRRGTAGAEQRTHTAKCARSANILHGQGHRSADTHRPTPRRTLDLCSGCTTRRGNARRFVRAAAPLDAADAQRRRYTRNRNMSRGAHGHTLCRLHRLHPSAPCAVWALTCRAAPLKASHSGTLSL